MKPKVEGLMIDRMDQNQDHGSGGYHFIPGYNFVWFAWMVRVDSCHQEILFQRNEKKARKARRRSADDGSTANDE